MCYGASIGDPYAPPWGSFMNMFIKKNVSKSLGKAAYDVRSVIRLVKVAGMLAANYFSFGPRNQLDFGFGMTNT